MLKFFNIFKQKLTHNPTYLTIKKLGFAYFFVVNVVDAFIDRASLIKTNNNEIRHIMFLFVFTYTSHLLFLSLIDTLVFLFHASNCAFVGVVYFRHCMDVALIFLVKSLP
jgi:dolichyl-phosphate-mannose--protein O-mannosyl transferase